MGRTQIAVTGTSTTGAAAPTGTAGDPDVGNSVANPDGRTVLVVANTGGDAQALAVQFEHVVDGQRITPRTYSIPAGTTRYIGPFPDGWYGTALRLDPESSDITIAAIRIGESIPAGATGLVPFWLVGSAVVADDTYPGITTAGAVLVVDPDLVPAAADGAALVVNV